MGDLAGPDVSLRKRRSFRHYGAFAALTLLASANLSAATTTRTVAIDLSNASLFDHAHTTAGGIWDITHSLISAGLAPGGTAGLEVDFGDGSDGVFDDGPAQAGVTIAGSTITFDTAVKSTFNFVTFHLSSGKTIVATGAAPLAIRVIGVATLDGTLNASGSAGTRSILSPATPVSAAGGSPGAGGAAGGSSGGYSGAAPTAGAIPASGTAATSGGGSGGVNSAVAANTHDAGGGANGTGPDAGLDATSGANGTAGTATNGRDVIATNWDGGPFAGGAGGGGGGSFLAQVSGGGGGGGGGAIHLSALGGVTVSGTIASKGGQGGANDQGTTPGCGGGGGGGAGGSVWIQSGQTIEGTGSLDVSGGAAGGVAGQACDNSQYGGVGSRGVYRADSVFGDTLASSPALPDVENSLISPTGSTYTIYSKAIPIPNAFETLDSATESVSTSGLCGNTGSVTVTYEGSNDGVTFQNPVAAVDIGQLASFSYLRIQVDIATTGPVPPCLAGISLGFVEKDLQNLTLKGGLFCGSLGGSDGFRSKKTPRSDAREALGDILMLAASAGLALFWRRTPRINRAD